MIYEGTNGIQALDLVGRKLSADGGKHTIHFIKTIKNFIKEAETCNSLKDDIIIPLSEALDDAEKCLQFFMEEGIKNPNQALAGATDFMHLIGYLSLGFMWARMAKTAHEELEK